MRVVATIVLAASALACSSASTGASASDGGPDGADALFDAQEAGVDTAPSYTPCGNPPYFALLVRVRYMNFSGDGDVLPGANVALDLCPDVALQTGSSGEVLASVQRGVPFTATISAPNHITVIAAEHSVDIGDPLEELRLGETLPLTNASSVLVGYASDAPSFAVVIEPDGISGSPCNTPSNMHFITPAGVTAHYMTPGWPLDTTEPIADASTGPVVFFTGLTGSATNVPPSTTGGAEAVCTDTAHGPPTYQTGKVKLAPGAWSVANVARVN